MERHVSTFACGTYDRRTVETAIEIEWRRLRRVSHFFSAKEFMVKDGTVCRSTVVVCSVALDSLELAVCHAAPLGAFVLFFFRDPERISPSILT